MKLVFLTRTRGWARRRPVKGSSRAASDLLAPPLLRGRFPRGGRQDQRAKLEAMDARGIAERCLRRRHAPASSPLSFSAESEATRRGVRLIYCEEAPHKMEVGSREPTLLPLRPPCELCPPPSSRGASSAAPRSQVEFAISTSSLFPPRQSPGTTFALSSPIAHASPQASHVCAVRAYSSVCFSSPKFRCAGSGRCAGLGRCASLSSLYSSSSAVSSRVSNCLTVRLPQSLSAGAAARPLQPAAARGAGRLSLFHAAALHSLAPRGATRLHSSSTRSATSSGSSGEHSNPRPASPPPLHDSLALCRGRRVEEVTSLSSRFLPRPSVHSGLLVRAGSSSSLNPPRSSSSPLASPSLPLGRTAALPLNAGQGPALFESRRFFYYRFHKHIGKGNFNRYLEFYQKPRGIENTLRLRYNYSATFTAKKRSEMWKVNLLKKIAHATDAKQVLDVWTYYRHRRSKRPYHYLCALQRLVEVGGCDPTDFRFRLIANGVYRSAKRFINLPRVCVYLAKLNATGDLQELARFLTPQVGAYFPHQLCLLAHAYGSVRLQDKVLFAAVDEALRPQLSGLSAAMLLKLTQGYAGALIHNYGLLARVSLILQQRVWRAAVGEEDEGERERSEHEAVERSKKRGVRDDDEKGRDEEDDLEACSRQTRAKRHVGPRCPSLEQLFAFGRVFAELKYQDFSYFETLSLQMQAALRADLAASPGRERFQRFSPQSVQELTEVLHRLKVNDVTLLQAILNHVHKRLYDYPPSCLAAIGLYTAQMLPCEEPFIRQVHTEMLEILQEAISVLDLRSLDQLAAFAKKAKPKRNRSAIRATILAAVEARVLELQGDGHTIFDVGRLLELLSLNGRQISEEAFQVLCRQAHRHLDLFEPQDFCRLSRALARVKTQAGAAGKAEGAFCSPSLVNALARRALRQQDEFSPRDFLNLMRSLWLAGPPDRVYAVPLGEKLRKKQVIHDYFPPSDRQTESPGDEESELSVSDLPVASRQTPALSPGRLLLGRHAVDKQKAAHDPRGASSEESTGVEAGAEEQGVPEGADDARNECTLVEGARRRLRRKRLEEKLRIAEEEGWDLLHRRVASLRELRGWM
ncbi:hypothetical protein BESB_083140 [Besnoitia besnoiti]|uniref:Uncharacterized protein n=1 Tax=Besnoitia besnoiti TaxID=94643 RepID=A0A2A9M573_BESBE|nr:hypothetical protein BESB_083140 [Besnoitia besnoiti]PFH33115.1 hypothetical protein BESB_083140 [Besnoitia besnoiti]